MNEEKRPQLSTHRAKEMEWLSENRERLEREHPGKWIAVQDDRLVGIGDDLASVLEQARSQGIEHPLVTAVRAQEYQGVLLVRTPKFIEASPDPDGS